MKKVNKLFLLVLGFVAGLLSGAFIRLGFEILNGYPRAIGGEALILPLIIFLICFGFTLGKEVRAKVQSERAYKRGYQQGYQDGRTDNCRTVTISVQEPKAVFDKAQGL